MNTALAQSSVRIDVGKARFEKSLMALPPLKYLDGLPTKSQRDTGKYLDAIIRNDLDTSFYFNFINPQAYIEDPRSVGLKPAPGEKKWISLFQLAGPWGKVLSESGLSGSKS